MKRAVVVNYSGGAGSFVAAERAVQRWGVENVTLLCADTNSEAPDWRLFVDASAQHLGAELVVLADGRDVWQLAESESMIPSNRVAFCSRILKRELLDKWARVHCDEHTIRVFGFDWTEEHRLSKVAELTSGRVEAPLCWDPVLSKQDCLDRIQQLGLPYPEAYALGLPHNNCLRYGCVRGGISYWKRLLEVLPEAYARSEAAEQRLRERIGDYSILRSRAGGLSHPLTLRNLRLDVQSQRRLFDTSDDYGACACWTD